MAYKIRRPKRLPNLYLVDMAKTRSKTVSPARSKKLPPKATRLFAGRLRIARERKYDNMAKAARALEVEEERYRTWERGIREPDITHLVRICEVFEVSGDFLLRGILPAAN